MLLELNFFQNNFDLQIKSISLNITQKSINLEKNKIHRELTCTSRLEPVVFVPLSGNSAFATSKREEFYFKSKIISHNICLG